MNETLQLAGAPGEIVRTAWDRARQDNPGVRARDAAALLGVPEASLVASLVGHGAVRLGGRFAWLLERMLEVGEVMVLTRNPSCVHEKVGSYGHITLSETGGVVLNREVDLRIFLGRWRHGFALEEPVKEGTRRSIQFFDEGGTAVHKIYARAGTDLAAWEALVEAFRAQDQSDSFTPAPVADKHAARPDDAVDLAGLRAAWGALEDVHDFFGMLKDFGVAREQAFRLVAAPFATRVRPASVRQVLERASAQAAPIMVFVGNRGCIQIHTGPVERIKVTGPWLNVLDPGFNLHLREDHIASAWVVRKPTRDGIVTSLEVFDADGANFAMFFGERHAGEKERADWRAIVAGLEPA
jgi:putative hemin transport protein